MIVVSDSSPLIALAAIGRLELLELLYGTVLIPESVHREINAGGLGAPGIAELSAASWIAVRSLSDRAFASSLRSELDEGEAEAIALALECGADLLLIDEHRGRAIAGRCGVRVTGVLGVLVEAKHRSILAAVKPALDALVSDAGFRVSDALYDRVLDAVGERTPGDAQ